MKKLSVILLSGVVLALAGCGNQGGSSDHYNTESGTISNTNYDRRSVTNDYQGSALTNDQILTIDPARTNNAPQY